MYDFKCDSKTHFLSFCVTFLGMLFWFSRLTFNAKDIPRAKYGEKRNMYRITIKERETDMIMIFSQENVLSQSHTKRVCAKSPGLFFAELRKIHFKTDTSIKSSKKNWNIMRSSCVKSSDRRFIELTNCHFCLSSNVISMEERNMYRTRIEGRERTIKV